MPKRKSAQKSCAKWTSFADKVDVTHINSLIALVKNPKSSAEAVPNLEQAVPHLVQFQRVVTHPNAWFCCIKSQLVPPFLELLALVPSRKLSRERCSMRSQPSAKMPNLLCKRMSSAALNPMQMDVVGPAGLEPAT
jgi:hypothetical protein